MNHGIRCPSTPRIGMRRFAMLVIAVLSAIASHSGQAAKIYRCGNVFQDQPCPEAKTAETRPVEGKSVAPRPADRVDVAERSPDRDPPRTAPPPKR